MLLLRTDWKTQILIKKGSDTVDASDIHHDVDGDDEDEDEDEEDYDRSRRGGRNNDGRIIGIRGITGSRMHDKKKTVGGNQFEEGDVELALHANDDHIRI